jgi:sugar O-acyltransferase (sialic acid O-acetyltransferase NeuD family)
VKRLAVLGASGHGKVIADLAEVVSWDEVVFFDDSWPQVSHNGSWSVAGDSQALLDQLSRFTGVVVAIGNNRIRADKLRWLVENAAPIVSLIHPSALISRYAHLGEGCVVMAGVVVNADANIADGVILNTCCSVDHDCSIGACAHISPGARLAGGVRVGAQSWVGIGACVKQLVSIGQQVVVGAGAVVVADLPDGITAVGVPARSI